MHAVGVTHRDVKLENIFLDASGAVKLGDFDLAVFHHEAQVGVLCLCCAGCCAAWAQGSVDNWQGMAAASSV
jgi:serine/threonine protein kinase